MAKMKPILLFLFLSAACGVRAQIDTTAEFVIGIAPKAILTIPAKSLDTARVLFVYCDTTYLSEKSSSMFSTTGYNINGTFTNYIPFVFCQIGYHVTNKIYVGEMNDPDLSPGSSLWRPIPVYNYKHIAYLDEKKKPLSKSIVVIQTIKL